MEKDLLSLEGLMLSVRKDLEIPPVLMNFLSEDDQGMEGLEFMMKDAKLCQRIPREVRYNYEILCHSIENSLTDEISNARKALDELEKNPRPMIHSIIQSIYEYHKSDE